MKKIAIASLIAFICWLYPINVLAQKTDTSETKELTYVNHQDPVLTDVKQTTEPNGPPKQTIPKPKAPAKLPEVQQRVSSGRDNPPYQGKVYSKEEVQDLIRSYSAMYGISADVPLCIAKLESGYNQFSKNKSSTASGVFQYLSNTWKSTDEGKAGLSVFDADSNVKAAIKYMAVHKNTRPWVVGPQCPKLTFIK